MVTKERQPTNFVKFRPYVNWG